MVCGLLFVKAKLSGIGGGRRNELLAPFIAVLLTVVFDVWLLVILLLFGGKNVAIGGKLLTEFNVEKGNSGNV